MTWLRAVLTVLRRIPVIVRLELEQANRRRDLLRYLDEETRTATWVCAHGDAWRRADGSLRRLQGGIVLPLTVADAEDFHAYVRRTGEASW